MGEPGETTAVESAIDSGPPHPDWQRGLDGKWYPPPAPRTLRRPVARVMPSAGRVGWRAKTGVLFLVLVGVVAVVVATVAVVNSIGDDSTNHAIGKTAHTGDFDVTVNGAQDPYAPATMLEAAPAGSHLVVIDVTMHNTNPSMDSIVSANAMFELTDGRGAVAALASVSSLDPIDTIVPHGDSRRGYVVFSVPDGAARPLHLRVKGEVSAGGVVFDVP